MKHSTTNVKKDNSISTLSIAAAAWIMLWQLCCVRINKPLLLPSPFKVLETLCSLAQTSLFWSTVATSLGKVLLAFVLAVIVGCFCAAIAAIVPAVRSFLHPPISIIRATPVASFTILAWVWIPSTWLPVFISFLMVLPIIYENIYKGILSTDRQLLEMAQVFHLSPWKKLRFLYFPAVLPYFSSACVNGMGFSWKSGIAAEILGLPKLAIGRQIHDAKIYIEIPELFAWTLVVILLSMLLEKLLLRLMNQVNRRFLLAKGEDK